MFSGTGFVPSSRDIKGMVEERIRQGRYAQGSRLPSVRVLAGELGVSHNLVHSAYLQLSKQGVVAARPRQGFFVIQAVGDGERRGPDSGRLRERLQAVCWEARMGGVSWSAFRKMAIQVVDEAFEGRRSRVGLVECNVEDARSLARALEMQLQIPVVPLSFEQLQSSPELLEGLALVCTTYYHIGEAERLLPGEVVPLHHAPSDDALAQIARIPAGARIAVVSPNSRTNKVLSGLVAMFHGAPYRLGEDCEAEEILRAAATGEIDVLVTIPSSHAKLAPEQLGVSTIVVSFLIQESSVRLLRQRLGGQPGEH
ncbi:MAG: GntR family transcriptional regulator [bacterium]|nr:GntR family transcriptional regulator [bacterium]